MRFTSTNPCSCLTLTQIPQNNHSRMKNGECESSLLARFCIQFEVLASEGSEGVWRSIYTSSPEKEPLGSGLPGDSGYKPEYSGTARFRTLNRVSGDSGQQGPEYQALYPEYPGMAGQKLLFCSFEWFLWLTCVFLSSLEN